MVPAPRKILTPIEDMPPNLVTMVDPKAFASEPGPNEAPYRPHLSQKFVSSRLFPGSTGQPTTIPPTLPPLSFCDFCTSVRIAPALPWRLEPVRHIPVTCFCCRSAGMSRHYRGLEPSSILVKSPPPFFAGLRPFFCTRGNFLLSLVGPPPSACAALTYELAHTQVPP